LTFHRDRLIGENEITDLLFSIDVVLHVFIRLLLGDEKCRKVENLPYDHDGRNLTETNPNQLLRG
jgi:hypothetical protein